MKRILLKQSLLLVALATTGTAYSLFSGLSPLPWAELELTPGEIRVVDAKALDVLWVDARPRGEYEEAHIPDALFFDEMAWDSSLVDLMNVWLAAPRPIVVYCGSQSCDTSQRIAYRLQEALPDAEFYSLKGGWDAWKQ